MVLGVLANHCFPLVLLLQSSREQEWPALGGAIRDMPFQCIILNLEIKRGAAEASRTPLS